MTQLFPVNMTAGVVMSGMASEDEVVRLVERAVESSASAVLSRDGAECMVKGEGFSMQEEVRCGEVWTGNLRLTAISSSPDFDVARRLDALSLAFESGGVTDPSGLCQHISLCR